MGSHLLWRRLGGDDHRVCYRGEGGQCDGGGKKNDKMASNLWPLSIFRRRCKHRGCADKKSKEQRILYLYLYLYLYLHLHLHLYLYLYLYLYLPVVSCIS